MDLEGQAPGPCQAGLGYQLWGPWILGCPVARELMASWNCQGRLVQGKTQAERTGGRGKGELGGRSNQIATAGTELWCSSEGGRGQGRVALGAWPQLSPPVVGKQGRLEAGTGPGRQTGLVPDPEGTVERRGRQASCHPSHSHAWDRHHQSGLYNRDYTALSHQAQAKPQILCTASTSHS